MNFKSKYNGYFSSKSEYGSFSAFLIRFHVILLAVA